MEKEKISLPVLTPDGRPWSSQPQWRRDFPIDVPEADYVARRDFTKFMVLTSLAFAIGQLWIAWRSWYRRAAPDASVRVAAIADLPVGGVISFAYPGPADTCLLIRPSLDSFVDYSAQCTHLACAVLPDVDKGILHCPCHNGLFDLATGRPLAGPPRRPLPRIRLEVKDGAVFAKAVEERTT
jgi:nitrite reductase/ring-hydroxylating ferredoxin subunit